MMMVLLKIVYFVVRSTTVVKRRGLEAIGHGFDPIVFAWHTNASKTVISSACVNGGGFITIIRRGPETVSGGKDLLYLWKSLKTSSYVDTKDLKIFNLFCMSTWGNWQTWSGFVGRQDQHCIEMNSLLYKDRSILTIEQETLTQLGLMAKTMELMKTVVVCRLKYARCKRTGKEASEELRLTVNDTVTFSVI